MSTLKEFDNKLNVAQMMDYVSDRIEHVGKRGGKSSLLALSPLTTMFSKVSFHGHFKLGLYGKGLNVA